MKCFQCLKNKKHFLPTLAVDSPKRPLGVQFVDMVQKHLPLLRIPEYGLQLAADHLEAWIQGKLPHDDFVDISPFLRLTV